MSLTLTLQNAVSGLKVNQGLLDIAANNIANSAVEGYSRKAALTENRVIQGRSSGVNLTTVRREVNESLIREVRRESSLLGESIVNGQFTARIENLFGTPESDTAISSVVGRLGSALEALSVAPEDFARRTAAIQAAQQVAGRLNTMATGIQDLRAVADADIDDAIDTINAALERVAELNKEIIKNTNIGLATGDLEDARDVSLASIGEYVDINTFQRDDGAIVVLNSVGRLMADTIAVALSYTPASSVSIGTPFVPITLGGVSINSEINSGRLSALLDQRDRTLPELSHELGELSMEMATRLVDGGARSLFVFSSSGTTTPAAGDDPARVFTVNTGATGLGNAANLDDFVVADADYVGRTLANRFLLTNIAFDPTGFFPGSTGLVATTGFTGYAGAILSKQATAAALVNSDRSYRELFVSNLKAQAAEESGVNIDEELANLVVYQNAYSASARAIQVADELLQTLNDIIR